MSVSGRSVHDLTRELFENLAGPSAVVVANRSGRLSGFLGRALSALGGTRRIVLHDLDRPLLSEAFVRQMLTGFEDAPMAVAFLPARNTYKEVRDGVVVRTVDRERLFLLQPPWIAERTALEGILDRLGARPTVMGSLMAGCRAAGIPVRFLAGDHRNIPLRSDFDARFAEQIWPLR